MMLSTPPSATRPPVPFPSGSCSGRRGRAGVERSGTPALPRATACRIVAGSSRSAGSNLRHLVIRSPGEDMCLDGLAAIDAQWGVRAGHAHAGRAPVQVSAGVAVARRLQRSKGHECSRTMVCRGRLGQHEPPCVAHRWPGQSHRREDLQARREGLAEMVAWLATSGAVEPARFTPPSKSPMALWSRR